MSGGSPLRITQRLQSHQPPAPDYHERDTEHDEETHEQRPRIIIQFQVFGADIPKK